MINETRVWLYSSTGTDYKGTELTQYLQPSDMWTDNLDDTLDTAEITLVGYPTRAEFAPSTKLIIEKGNYYGTDWVAAETFHWTVSSDTVEQPIISNDSYFTHAISLIEPAIVSQQRLCDNFSVTYKLQDVNLNVKPSYDTTSKMNVNRVGVSGIGSSRQFGYHKKEDNHIFYSDVERTWAVGHKFEWVMPTWYQVQLYKEEKSDAGVITRTLETRTPSWDDWTAFQFNQEIPTGETSKQVRLPIPLLRCYTGVEDTTNQFSQLGYCSLSVSVTRTKGDVTENVALNGTTLTTITVNPSSAETDEAWTNETLRYREKIPQNPSYGTQTLVAGWIASRMGYRAVSGSYHEQLTLTKLAEFSSTTTNRTLFFDVENGWAYTIYVQRKVFSPTTYAGTIDAQLLGGFDSYPYGAWTTVCTYRDGGSGASNFVVKDQPYSLTNSGFPQTTGKFFAVAQGDTYTQLYRSAPPVSALELFNKGQLATQSFYKQSGVSVYDMSLETAPNGSTPQAPFYLSYEDEQELRYTQIVENFFNQQNLWQIFREVGNYIHARPKVLFGSNDRFRVTWKRYGRTDQSTDKGTKASVFNSRFVEEYISATSSYVANMVQLGGSRTEYLKAVGMDDNYTVSNDNSMLKTQTPIVEILDMQVRKIDSTEWFSLVGKNNFEDGSAGSGFIFEKGVYDTLGISTSENVNKGLAIYYTLGTNEIRGFNFRLPTVSSGDVQNDYAIKKVIYRATTNDATGTDWKNIRVNDYMFKITYRTKDTLRIDQSRPDLRKYLLNSRYDLAPQHYQFNNQQDVMVDSQAFGENVYGKLIRTGNTIFEVLEWHSDYADVKHAGELYKIYDNLYYVSKVTNTQFPDHIESKVEYCKDFNRLSQIIGIPSEPRFYEISEQNAIRREKVLTEYIAIGGSEVATWGRANQTVTASGLARIRDILFLNGKYPQWAKSHFLNDSDSQSLYEQDVKTLHGLMVYNSKTSLIMEWDMVDNYSAGDQTFSTEASPDDADNAYRTMTPYRYCDEFGRADLFNFAICDDFTTQLTDFEIYRLPALPTRHGMTDDTPLFTNQNKGAYALLKDNREAMSFNYTLQAVTTSDRYILSSYLWQDQKGVVYLAFGLNEINRVTNDAVMENELLKTSGGDTVLFPITQADVQIVLNRYMYLDVNSILTRNGYSTVAQQEAFLSNVSSIIVAGGQVRNTPNGLARLFGMAYNCSDLTAVQKKQSIFIGAISTGFFEQHQ